THFNIEQLVPGTSLYLGAFIDDGAVVFLNGAEIWRVRMPFGQTAATRANGYPCDGDATCLEEYLVPASALGSLSAGDNVLAVEVHNYQNTSGDITFGLAASLIQPVSSSTAPPTLTIETDGERFTLRWSASGFRLQSTDSPLTGWQDESDTSPAFITPA